jgi:hypothetical protein
MPSYGIFFGSFLTPSDMSKFTYIKHLLKAFYDILLENVRKFQFSYFPTNLHYRQHQQKLMNHI